MPKQMTSHDVMPRAALACIDLRRYLPGGGPRTFIYRQQNNEDPVPHPTPYVMHEPGPGPIRSNNRAWPGNPHVGDHLLLNNTCEVRGPTPKELYISIKCKI